MIDYVNYAKFNKDSIDKQLTLTFSGGDVMTNANIEQEAFQLKESICSEEQLAFGSCEASELTFTVWGIYTSHVGQTVTVSLVIDGDTANPFTIGTYKVVQDTASADRTKRTMVCYDALYDVLNADVAGWYNTLFPDSSTTKTIKQIRDSFFTHFGITQESATLVNDEVVVGKTIQPTSLSGKDVLRAICELNGVFGHITRDNNFRYVSLKLFTTALYPAEDLYPDDDVYPSEEGGTTEIAENGNYISLDFEDYTTALIDKVVIRQEDTDIGAIAGTGTNAYIVQGNFLVFGMDAGDLAIIANALYAKISGIWYRPFEVELRANPCIEVGDGVYMGSKYEVIYGYVLQRIYKGIQAAVDTLIADGNEYRNDQVNAVNTEIIRLRGQSAVLKKDINEVSVQMMRQLDSTVEGSYAYVTAQQIGLKVSKENIVSDLNDKMESGITIEPNRITIGSTGALVINTTNFKLDASGNVRVSGEVNASSGSIGGFTITDSRIESDPDLVGVGSPGVMIQKPVSSSTIVFAAGYTNPESLISSPFQVAANGRLIARNAYISGSVNASSGYIGEFEISYDSIQTDPYYVDSDYRGVYIKTGAAPNETAISVGYTDPAFVDSAYFRVMGNGSIRAYGANFERGVTFNSVITDNFGNSFNPKWRKKGDVGNDEYILAEF